MMPSGGLVPDLSSAVSVEVSRQLQAQLASNNPAPEATNPSPGTQTFISRMDHVHPRLSSTDQGTLDANGEAVISFTRTFATKPSWFAGYEEEANGLPVMFKIKTWTQDSNGNYIGCVLKGYRLQAIPAMSGVTLPTQIVLQIGGFNVAAGNANAVQYAFVAIASSK